MISALIRAASSSVGFSDSNAEYLDDHELWPKGIKENYSILTEKEKKSVVLLLKQRQHHLFNDWEGIGINDNCKHDFFTQIDSLNESYPYKDGLVSYLSNARKLLSISKKGENPLDGWTPEIPTGIVLDPATTEYDRYESIGLEDVKSCGFVLVAGGLGERLGYNGIKVALPVETTTNISYIEYYCQQILAMQSKYFTPTLSTVSKDGSAMSPSSKSSSRRVSLKVITLSYLPLAIMVSDDTFAKTQEMLEANSYFGLLKEQVTLMKQEKVASLVDNDAKIAMQSTYVIDSKPHGHGDIHALMYSTGTAKRWIEGGVKYCVFFQDTNALAFHTLPVMLGVSKVLELEVNSLAIQRVAKQAIGAITKLVSKDKSNTITVNVEYNQLDPLLRATVSPDGDVNDPVTGKSPYPGNINQLLFRMDAYVKNLYRTNGIMSEFVNPKYANETKTFFKKPTRLECMMQDYPKILDKDAKVGFTSLPAWICFSPCKNNSSDAAAASSTGLPPGSAFSAESDQYNVCSELIRTIGGNVTRADPVTYLGITCIPGPRVVVNASTAIFLSEYKKVFTKPTDVTIKANSSLVIQGDVEIRRLNLDGALHLVAIPGTKLIVCCSRKKPIYNRGHVMRGIDQNDATLTEVDRMRGYKIHKYDEEVISTVSPIESVATIATAEDNSSAISGTDSNNDNTFVYTGSRNLVPYSSYIQSVDGDGDDATICSRSCFLPTIF